MYNIYKEGAPSGVHRQSRKEKVRKTDTLICYSILYCMGQPTTFPCNTSGFQGHHTKYPAVRSFLKETTGSDIYSPFRLMVLYSVDREQDLLWVLHGPLCVCQNHMHIPRP